MDRDTACTAGLFNLSPYTAGRCFNQLNSQYGAKFTHFGSKEKSYTKFICFAVFILLSILLGLGPRRATFTQLSIPDTWKNLFSVLWDWKCTVLCQPKPCYINHSISTHTLGQMYKLVFLMPFSGVKLVSTRADLNDKVWKLRYVNLSQLLLCWSKLEMMWHSDRK